ncbi:MAG: serine hydrolase [Roseivirga sp.]|nr:serine hydrolase [Roseivirga sp.]
MKYRFIALLLLVVTFANAQKGAQKDIDTFIQKTLKAFPEVPGISIAVVQGNRPLFVKGYGYADREKDIKSEKSTPFYIASTTKSFMSMLSVILEQEGKLDLDTPLTTYKPFKYLKNKSVFEQITITDLLNHTSGIENGFLTFRDAYTGDKSADIMSMLLEEVTELKEDGKVYEYDNLGYNILDVLLQKELNLDWRELLDEKLFTPLGMKRTTAYISEGERKNWKMAWPYMSYKQGETPRAPLMKDDSMMQAAGGLICSAEDAANWLLFNINSGKLKGKQIYPASLVDRTHKTLSTYDREGQIFHDKGYGLGWINAKFKDKDIVYHFGGYTGFFSHISFMPSEKIGIAVFANESFFGDNVSNLIATYVYDYLTNLVPAEGYDKGLEQLRAMVARLHGGFARDTENRAKREWKLDLPMKAYTGKYYNKHMGTIQVVLEEGKPKVSLGRLNSVAEPFTRDNSMRVMLIPLRGEPLMFKPSGNQVNEVVYKGQSFTRIDP